MKRTIKFSSIFISLSIVNTINAARILGIFPVTGKSHFSCNQAVMKSLHKAGHDITMITPFASDTPTENFTYIDSRSDKTVFFDQWRIEDMAGMSLATIMTFAVTTDIQSCYDVMNLKIIQEALNSPVKLYDVLFVEILFAHECYLPLAEKLGIPIIGTVTFHIWKLADSAIGLPNNPAVINAVGTTFLTPEPELNLFERIQSLWSDLTWSFIYEMTARSALGKFHQEYFPEKSITKKDISLIFYNNHPTLLPRIATPNSIDIGGIHLEPAKKLPEDIQTFIDGARHGVILFTFGSVVKMSSLASESRQTFIEAFGEIPQRVLWRFEEPIDHLPENIKTSSWLPQRDILEHKNVIGFISHCGQSGTYEAIMTGTPVVAVPLFGDQYQIASLLLRRKVAISLDLETVTKKTVLEALNAIVNDTSYYHNMKALSRAFKDRPMSPEETVVYWTEYVIRSGGAPLLEPMGKDVPFWRYFMIDIILIFFVFTIVLIFIVHALIRIVYYKCLRRRGDGENLTLKKNS